MNLGERGAALIKSYESLKLEAYHGAADPEGVWTIGWGHTKGVKEGDVITEEQAESFFQEDVAWAVEAVNETSLVERTTQAQFDAMVSLTFNIGAGGFSNSTVLRLHNAFDFFGACGAFYMWNRSAGQPRRGLLRRRAEEALLYCQDRWD